MEQREYALTVSSNTLNNDDLCLNNFSRNLCCVIKHLTPGNVEGVARQHVYIVAIATKNLVAIGKHKTTGMAIIVLLKIYRVAIKRTWWQ